jgi:hypothetical protein
MRAKTAAQKQTQTTFRLRQCTLFGGRRKTYGQSAGTSSQLAPAFSDAISGLDTFSPRERLATVVELAQMTSSPQGFEGVVWKNAIGGCGGGVISTIAEECLLAIADVKKLVPQGDESLKNALAAFESVSGGLEDYGLDHEYEEVVAVLQKLCKV